MPPVERISTPSAARLLAKSATPVLSETEISARRTRIAPSLTACSRVSGAVSVIDHDQAGSLASILTLPCASMRIASG